MKSQFLRYGALAVFAHIAVMLPHGVAHNGVAALLPFFANAYVALVIVLAPLVALWLLRGGLLHAGALLLFASMLGALLFGIAYHYLIPGSDHVGHVPAGPWQLPFQITAALLIATEAAGTVVGAWMLYGLGRSTQLKAGQ